MIRKIKKIILKIHFFLIIDGDKRAEFLKKHNILKGIGEGCLFQSRNFPMDPKLLLIHRNATIAANVHFITHDAIRHVLERKYKNEYSMNLKPIEICDNVFIGLGSIIYPNVKIGKNCIVAAGSVVIKDVEEGSIVGGNPAKKIGDFEALNNKRLISSEGKTKLSYQDIINLAWSEFDDKYGQ